MLIYTKRAAPKEPKRRSRAGCIHCKEKKKKCNEKRPQCDRCIERGLPCGYEAVKPRKRRRTSFAGSALSADGEFHDDWPAPWERQRQHGDGNWEHTYPDSDTGHLDWDPAFGDGDDVEEIARAGSFEETSLSSAVRSRSNYPDLAMIAPSPVPSPLLEFSSPLFMEFTEKRNRRVLVDHFCNVLSHLIVFKEDTGNPFRQLVLPLSHASSPVMNAIFALSCAHLEYRGIHNEEKSLTFHNKALQGLAQLIETNDPADREQVLGAIMLLVYYEVLVQKSYSNIVTGHLKGAMTVIKSGPQASSPTSLFLEHAFRFYDVIAALSLGAAPNASTQPTAAPFQYPSTDAGPTHSPLSAVDTLLGLSTDLWPIIHRLSHLLSYKNSLEAAVAAGETSKATVLRTELESTSQAIEIALTEWKPTVITSQVADLTEDQPEYPTEQARVQSILNNAEAYRHSAFVYLYRTIRAHPREHALVQRHAHASLLACWTVVTSAERCYNGPMAALLWPLFVAACEALSEADRELTMQAFLGIERRQGMNNIVRAWEVVQEVWKRADGGEIDVNWRDICVERGFNIVFG